MVRKFFTVEYVMKENGEKRMVLSMIDQDVKKKIFYDVEEFLKYLRNLLKEDGETNRR